jgi:hypothetical protein
MDFVYKYGLRDDAVDTGYKTGVRPTTKRFANSCVMDIR